MTRGLLLFAHGARDARWSLPFEDVARRIRQAEPGLHVELAFLEFMAPDIAGAGAALAQAGCVQVDVVPMFLGVGGHVRKDLPLLMDGLAQTHPSVRWQLRNAIGEADSVIAAMALAAVGATRSE
jgi:sirohydrochlorin cobaltochelatase